MVVRKWLRCSSWRMLAGEGGGLSGSREAVVAEMAERGGEMEVGMAVSKEVMNGVVMPRIGSPRSMVRCFSRTS